MARMNKAERNLLRFLRECDLRYSQGWNDTPSDTDLVRAMQERDGGCIPTGRQFQKGKASMSASAINGNFPNASHDVEGLVNERQQGMSELSKRLRNKRKDKKLTLAAVSEATGLSISFLSDMERGQTEPSLKTLRTLADFHGVPVDSLLVQAVAAMPQDDQERETAISSLRDLVDDYTFAVGQAGDLSGAEVGAWEYGL